MGLVLCRVDDRLVHGQVVIGWGRPLAVKFIALVDDGVRGSSWEQDLYRMAVPDGVELHFAGTEEAIAALPTWAADPRPGILLTGDLETMATLHSTAPEILRRINLGGIHHRADRHERLRYIYLSSEEELLLAAMRKIGADITAQDLPTTPPIGMEAMP
jgi:PTS system mannose-specific IIB component/fructoselysine and glucoselysine-specific PTS system IIB component